ncbi:DUF4194 domain-containing protein [Microbacterium sp. CJ88]|uniref:DUF4194 domain-containing protein n=1 Tax=Microbacterium sp. CJ88 TaxID=3445672 RepID=UPI003F65521C
MKAMTTSSDFDEVADLDTVIDDPTDSTPRELLGEEPDIDDDNPTIVEFDGDIGTLHPDARAALVALLSDRFITAATHKREWKGLAAHRYDIRSRLNDLYLDLEYDARYEVAFKVQVRNTDSTRSFPHLLRSMTWNREQTIVLVFLCIAHRNQTVAGASRALVTTADIHAFAVSVRPKAATDHHMDAGRVDRAILAVAATGLLDSTKEEGVYEVSPVIERLMPVTKLRELLAFLATEDPTDD